MMQWPEFENAADVISNLDNYPPRLEKTIPPFAAACYAFADTLAFHGILSDGDLDVIQQNY
jgi:hypothetical protein